MKPIKLEDLTPEGASFTLAKTGKTYHLKPFSLADEAWLNKTFGTKLDSIFREMKMVEIARIVFHQMEETDKQDFLRKEVSFINDEGVETTHQIGGAELLFWLISGFKEKIAIFEALMQTIGISRGMLDDLMEEQKKSAIEASRQIGQSSSTDSQASTVGQPNTFGPEQSGKSLGG